MWTSGLIFFPKEVGTWRIEEPKNVTSSLIHLSHKLETEIQTTHYRDLFSKKPNNNRNVKLKIMKRKMWKGKKSNISSTYLSNSRFVHASNFTNHVQEVERENYAVIWQENISVIPFEFRCQKRIKSWRVERRNPAVS